MTLKQILGVLVFILSVLAGGQVTAQSTTGREREAALKQAQEAQQQAREAVKQAQEAKKRAIKEIRRIKLLNSRPRIGIVVDTSPNPKTDPYGALVQAVTPGSPAQEAGLQSGDIITRFDGKTLAAAKGREHAQTPGERLIALAHDLKDGQKVALEYRRDGKPGKATVTARKMSLIDIDENDFHWLGNLDRLPLEIAKAFPASWLNLELVDLNPKLGSYFGTSKGVLVIEAPGDNGLNLEGGDVILKIGDREPLSASQAFRIFRSYDPGQEMTLQVMRHRRKITLKVKVPQPTPHKYFKFLPKPPVPPAPPAPPAPAPSAAPRAPHSPVSQATAV